MIFGILDTRDCAGAILAHSVPLPGGGRLRKGQVLGRDDIDMLLGAGVPRITVARLGADDLREDEAAARLGQALVAGAGDATDTGLRASAAATGRANIYATRTGVVEMDADRIRRLNAIDPMITLAVTRPYAQCAEGGMIGTVKIISYGVQARALEKVAALARGAMRVRPVVLVGAELIVTRTNGAGGDAEGPEDKGIAAVRARLAALGMALERVVTVPHREDAIAAALGEGRADLRLILTGSATSDIHDVAPTALVAAGGRVSRFGMPVDPGNLLFLGDLGGTPVIGLPGCARSPALNGADFVLSRVACGIHPGPEDFADMAIGGLLKETRQRGRPREG